eukprot:6212938-Pleurochrysis_carterae.AAC.11
MHQQTSGSYFLDAGRYSVAATIPDHASFLPSKQGDTHPTECAPNFVESKSFGKRELEHCINRCRAAAAAIGITLKKRSSPLSIFEFLILGETWWSSGDLRNINP